MLNCFVHRKIILLLRIVSCFKRTMEDPIKYQTKMTTSVSSEAL